MTQHPILSEDVPPAIKCDRRSPCANRFDADVECQRLRRGRSSKKRTFSCLLTPEESLVDIERPLRHEPSQPLPNLMMRSTFHTSTASVHIIPDAPDQGRRESSPVAATKLTSGADDSNYHAIQAKNVIQLELDDSRSISRERQCILKSALELVSEIARSEHRHSDLLVEDEPLLEEGPAIVIPDAPPRELLFMLLRGPSESMRVRWPDHITDKCYERMATALLQGDVAPPSILFHQYCVCIYVKAIVHLDKAFRTTENVAIKSQLSQSRSIYAAAASRSIQHFNLLSRPDLTTIQCLISGALLMQCLGRLNQCWVLNSYASQQITSLNYHKIRTIPANTDEDQEIYSAVYWCYYLDRTLSNLLGRPSSLPDLEVSPTDLIPSDLASPYDTVIRVLLDLAQIQEKLHAISCSNHESKHTVLETCLGLESKMESIFPRLQLSRDSLPKVVRQDWVSVDFCYYAIFVEIHRTRLKVSFSPLIHRLCLVYAQNSLKAFYFLLQQPGGMPGLNNPYPSFLTWTLFFYPLSPFFVVFCNIVATLNHDNYKLLRDITSSLSQFKRDSHLERLLDLLRSLQRLCEPLFQEQSVDNPAREDISAHLRPSSALPVTTVDTVGLDATENPLLTAPLDADMALSNATIPNTEVNSSTDWMMWQLFNSQVPAGWITSDSNPFNF
ncbi:hypothetical protein BDV12DRAFT_169235 [Aspergillus spectabilis]